LRAKRSPPERPAFWSGRQSSNNAEIPGLPARMNIRSDGLRFARNDDGVVSAVIQRMEESRKYEKNEDTYNLRGQRYHGAKQARGTYGASGR